MDEEFGRDDEAQEASETEASSREEKTISADLIRGHINTIILRALYDGDKYGYEIISEIEQKSHGQYSMKQPSLYSALKRLESQGYITSYWGGSVSGGRRKYFSLTEEGRKISERNQSEWEYSRTVIDSLISEKQFDFNNPAPTAVDMRVLKQTTSRVPSRGQDGEYDEEFSYTGGADSAEQARLIEEQARREAELEQARAALEEERERSEKELAELEEAKKALAEERERSERELAEREASLRSEREKYEEELAERERKIEEEKQEIEALRSEQTEQIRITQETYSEQLKERDERILRAQEMHSEDVRAREEALRSERMRYEQMLAERERLIAQERAEHVRELEEQEQRIRAEQERLFAQRERQVIHENYLRLVSSPPPAAQEPQEEYSYYTPPNAAAEESSSESLLYAKKPESEREYRSIIHKLYANAVKEEEPAPAEEAEEESAEERAPRRTPAAQSLGRIDFYDLEARAAQDGIRITTSGGIKPREPASTSVVNKGKALFFSAIAAFLFSIAVGAVALVLKDTYAIPALFPYLMWGIGFALLLVTGVAYANRFGEHALRYTGNAIPNAIVAYALLAIADVVAALACKMDFTDLNAIVAYIVFPCVYFLAVIIFAVTYVLIVKPSKK